MDEIPQIDIDEAKKILDAEGAVFIDIRDPGTFAGGHIAGATNVGDHNIREFVETTDKAQKVIAYCYHGNSSQGATAWLQEQGFTDVHSMRGGFEMWRVQYPFVTED